MLSKGGNTRSEPQRPDRFDPFLADRDLRASFRALVEGDWPRLEAFMETSPKAWLFSHIIVSPVVDMERLVFERWAETDRNPHARILLAGAIVRDAIGGRGPNDDADAVADYEYAVRGAEEMLREVVRERPAMPEPWVQLLVTGRALGVKLEELRQRFDNAHSRDPFRPDACHQYLQSLTEKWGGSQTAVFDFARWLEVEAPPDSPAREALPIAHIEQGLTEQSDEELERYLAQPEVAGELSAALLKYLNAIPVNVASDALGALNAYALALNVTEGRTARLVEDVFDRIGDRPTAYPWSLYREGVVKVFRQVEAEQRRKAARFEQQ